MTRRLWILLGVAVYVLVLWIIHKARRAKARRVGLSPKSLSAFDHRGFLDELGEVYAAGLPPQDSSTAAKSARKLEARLPPELKPLLGSPPRWHRPEGWSGSLRGLPEPIVRARDHLDAGKEKEVDRLVEAGQEAAVDQALASLAIHYFIERLYEGDLDGASALMAKLPLWTRDRIGVRVVDRHRAQIALLRAALKPAETKWPGEARQMIKLAGGGGRYADVGTLALWAHLSLTHGQNFLFEDLTLMRVDRALRRGLFGNRSSAILYYELAHCCLWRGRLEEAVDHLARALYFAGGDAFYARPILGWPELARLKPSLVKQARAIAGVD